MKPNILFIMGDQHRYDCIGAYGNKDIKTPHLDQLAQEGVLHTEHYTTYPVCTPARYSILTGLYTHQHLGWSNHSTLASGFKTFPKLLRENGYKTTTVGKMHLTPTYLDVGFDKMILAEQDGDGRFDDDYHAYLMEKGLVDENDITDQREEYRQEAKENYWDTYGALTSNLKEENHSTTWTTNRAIEQLEGWTEDSNMLMVSYIKPHHPFDPPAPYDTLYDPQQITLLPGYTEEVPAVDYKHHTGYFDHKGLTEERLRRITAYYYGSISHMDYHIGRIIEKLKEKGLYENTLIIYTSDHGDYLGYHHMLLKANYMYDPVAKVPFIIKYPKEKGEGKLLKSKRAKINEQISCNLDIATTVLRQCEVPVPHLMKGINMANPSEGRKMTICEGFRVEEVEGESAFYYEYMVRSKKYKLITSKNKDNYRFFDLTTDPYELNDVAQDVTYKEEIQAHIDYLTKVMTFEALAPNYENLDEKVCGEDKKMSSEKRDKTKAYFETYRAILQGGKNSI